MSTCEVVPSKRKNNKKTMPYCGSIPGSRGSPLLEGSTPLLIVRGLVIRGIQETNLLRGLPRKKDHTHTCCAMATHQIMCVGILRELSMM